MEKLKEIFNNLSPQNKKILICVAIVVVLFLLFKACDSESSSMDESSKPTSYIEAIKVNDFATAHEILDQRLERSIKLNASGNWSSDEALEDFWAAADHVYKAEMMYLIEMKDAEANKRLINTLAMMNIIGDRPPHQASAYGSGMTKYDNYQVFVTRYNRLCDEILSISILNNNKDMAKMILNLYKEDCAPHYKKPGNDDYYYFDISTKSKDAALKKYNDAIKNGLLN